MGEITPAHNQLHGWLAQQQAMIYNKCFDSCVTGKGVGMSSHLFVDLLVETGEVVPSLLKVYSRRSTSIREADKSVFSSKALENRPPPPIWMS